MKAAALMLGIALLSVQLSEAEAGRIAREDRTAVSPRRPRPAAGDVDLSAANGRSQRLSPQDLITTSPEGEVIEFLMTALENRRVLVWLGGIAKSKATRKDLRALGDSLQGSQESGNKLIVQIAKRKGLNVENDNRPIQLNVIASRLPQATGPKFDKVLIECIVAACQHAVSTYESGVQSEDEEIRGLSKRALPQAKAQLQDVRRASGEMR
ncbi:DUF4142 domain-containing protein [Verrucomicrobiota bacterium sgz303538]